MRFAAFSSLSHLRIPPATSLCLALSPHVYARSLLCACTRLLFNCSKHNHHSLLAVCIFHFAIVFEFSRGCLNNFESCVKSEWTSTFNGQQSGVRLRLGVGKVCDSLVLHGLDEFVERGRLLVAGELDEERGNLDQQHIAHVGSGSHGGSSGRGCRRGGRLRARCHAAG